MTLQTQIQFAKIYSKLVHEKHDVSDISKLISTIRLNSENISDDAKKLLLSIPLCVLNNHVELSVSRNIWSSKNGSYFAGNFAQEPFHSKFKSNNFDLEDISNSLEDIISDSIKLNSDFHLRNPEVTLRDDVMVKEFSDFKECGKIFARAMEKAFDL